MYEGVKFTLLDQCLLNGTTIERGCVCIEARDVCWRLKHPTQTDLTCKVGICVGDGAECEHSYDDTSKSTLVSTWSHIHRASEGVLYHRGTGWHGSCAVRWCEWSESTIFLLWAKRNIYKSELWNLYKKHTLNEVKSAR